jgi:hypothetical protein
MEHIAPLVQTVLWVTLIGVALWRFHRPIYGLLEALQRRVEAGSNIEAGPFKLTDQLKPQDPITQRQKVASEMAETLEVASASDVGASLDEAGRRATVQAKYFQAEDLVLRAIQAEYGATISRQVTAGSDMGFDGAFVTNGRLNIVEVKFLRGPSGNVSRLRPSVERLVNAVVSYGWKNAQIILAVVFEREEEVARATELLKVITSGWPISIVIRCYSLVELQRRFGISDQPDA